MKNTLIDAGPFIALFSPRDRYHSAILDFLKTFRGGLITTWPVITETCHMLDFDVRAQIAFLEWLDRGAAQIHEIRTHDLQSIIQLTQKYSDIPMDLADASLIVASQALGIKTIITIDSDFDIYRTIRKEKLKNIFKK